MTHKRRAQARGYALLTLLAAVAIFCAVRYLPPYQPPPCPTLPDPPSGSEYIPAVPAYSDAYGTDTTRGRWYAPTYRYSTDGRPTGLVFYGYAVEEDSDITAC